MMKSLRTTTIIAAAAFALCRSAYATHVDERPAYFVEWLGGDGNQQLDTEYVFKVSPRVETSMMLLSNADKDVAGTPTANASCFIIDYKDAGKIIYYRYHNKDYTSVTYPSSILNQWVDVSWGSNVCHNGTVLKPFAPKDFSDNTATFRLFYARHGMPGLRFKRVQMYDGDDLVRDLWPAVRANGTPCMYDSVTDKCYLNTRTGTFSVGPLCDGYDYSSASAVWSNLSGGRFDANANWSGGVVPQAGDTAAFSDSGTYTVTFPPEGLDTLSDLVVSKDSGTTTFDASGTWWRIPSSDNGEGGTTHSAFPVFIQSGGVTALSVARAGNDCGVMLLSNGVFSVSAGEVFATRLSGGLLNLFDPDASAISTNIFAIGTGGDSSTVLAGDTRLPAVNFASGGTTGNLLRFQGGTHEAFGRFDIAPASAGTAPAVVELSNGADVTLHGGMSIGTAAEADIDVSGASRLAFDPGLSFSAAAKPFSLTVRGGSSVKFGGAVTFGGTDNCTSKVVVVNSVFDASAGALTLTTNAKRGSHLAFTNSVILLKGLTVSGGTVDFVNCVITNTDTLTVNSTYGDHAVYFKDCDYHGTSIVPKGGSNAVIFDGGNCSVSTLQCNNGQFRLLRGTVRSTPDRTLASTSSGHTGSICIEGGDLYTAEFRPSFVFGGNGTIYFLGGTVHAPSITGWAGTPHIVGNGGTATPTAATTGFISGNTFAWLGPKGLTIDTPYAVTVAQTFTNWTEEAGELIKAGAGTLTLSSGASRHSRTVVREGTLVFATAVTNSYPMLVSTNGGVISFTGAHTGLTTSGLTLGDGATRGVLAIDNDTDLVEVVEPGGFHPLSALIRLTDLTTNGTYPVVAVAGEADAATAALWANNSACPTTEGKAYTFTSQYDAGTDTTTFYVTTADRVASSGDVVWQGPGTSWAEGANWEGGAAPTETDTAVFSSESAPASVSVPSGATAGALAFNAAQSYTLSGASPLALSYAVDGSIDVQRGSHTNAVPLNIGAVMPINVAADASLAVTAPMTVGGIAKQGRGMLTLSGANALPYGIEVRDGTMDIPVLQAIQGSTTILSGGTLRYTGAAAATPASITLNTGASTKSAILRTDADLELTGGMTSTSGAFIKRGAGTLKIDQPAGRALGANAASGAGNAFAFDPDGSAPTTGFSGVNVAEGELRVTTSGSISLGGDVRVGLNSGDVGDSQPRLVVQSGTISATSRSIQIGSALTAGSTATNPALVIVNSSVSVKTVASGSSSSAVPVFPIIALTNATVSGTLSIGSTLNDFTTIRAVNSTIGGAVESGWNGGLDADLDGSFFKNEKRFFMTGNVYGTIRARNGSTVQIGGWMLYPPKRSMTLSFDASTFTFSDTLLFFHPEQHAVVAEAGGMNLDVPSGKTATFRHPISGPGAVTKIGPGTAFFDLAQGANNWQGYANNQVRTQCVDTVTMAYAGPTTIAEGTVIVTNGAVRENAVFKLREAGTLNLRFCEHHFASVTGQGVVTNGGLVQTTVAGTTNGVLKLNALSLDRATFSYPVANGQTNLVPQVAFNGCSYTTGVTVDFGHDRSDPLIAEAEGVIATYTGETPDVASWTLTGLGGHRSIATLRAADGNIYLTLEKTPAGTIILLR